MTQYVLLKKTSLAEPEVELYDGDLYFTFEAAEAVAQNAWLDGDELIVGEVKEVSWDPPQCSAMVYAGSRYVDPEPPEYCDEPAVLGTEYCTRHSDQRP